MGLIVKEYHASPTMAQFHQSDLEFRYIEGPVGSGKSTACIMELLRLAMLQEPDSHGVRKSKWAVIRATNPQLRSTTIKTFSMWIPPSVAPVVYNAPINAQMNERLADGTTLEVEFIFLALDQEEDVNKLTSLEVTGAYINEGREIVKAHVETLKGRIDRFPQTIKDENGKRLYGPTNPCIIMDSNPPKTTHWIFETFHGGKVPEGYGMFVQPPAVFWVEDDTHPDGGYWELNPDAENLSHLSDKYYARQLHGASDEYIRVMLAGEPGMTNAGKPVFPNYTERKHVAPVMLNPIRGLPIIIGMDFGLTPAAIFGQLGHKGYRVLDELPMTDESLEDFIDEYVKPLLAKRYAGYEVIAAGDPAGSGRNDIDKRTRFNVLNERGIRAYPANTNSFITRKETVDWFLRRDEGLLISPHCIITREALAGGYVYKEVRGTGGRYMERPDKNAYSHPMDALQYALLYCKYGFIPTKKATQADTKKFLYV